MPVASDSAPRGIPAPTYASLQGAPIRRKTRSRAASVLVACAVVHLDAESVHTEWMSEILVAAGCGALHRTLRSGEDISDHRGESVRDAPQAAGLVPIGAQWTAEQAATWSVRLRHGLQGIASRDN